jgi:hypothetical protein
MNVSDSNVPMRWFGVLALCSCCWATRRPARSHKRPPFGSSPDDDENTGGSSISVSLVEPSASSTGDGVASKVGFNESKCVGTGEMRGGSSMLHMETNDKGASDSGGDGCVNGRHSSSRREGISGGQYGDDIVRRFRVDGDSLALFFCLPSPKE